jgi:exopolyphosphatase/guanosine-5'-triphosphate,3'-diphosphate pyrophosphatase
MRVAAVDVGSNSIHMLVAQVESDGRFHVLDRAKEMVRLGRQTLSTGHLSADAIEAGVKTLSAFHTLAERQGVTRIKAVATSAVREAANGGEFIQRVRKDVGLTIKVIPGPEEARLIYLGVRHAIDLGDEATLIVDIGGGSVELVLVENGQPITLDSVKLGVARLSEQFLPSDPPTSKEVAQLEKHLSQHLGPILARALKHRVRRVIGTSGTLLNIASIGGHLRGDPPNGHLHNFVVTADEVHKVRRLCVKTDRHDRARIKGLDGKRADLIPAGACLIDHIMSEIHAEQLTACTWSLREGVLLDFIARHQKGIEETERFATPRQRSVARLARHLGEAGEHGSRVAALASSLFDQLGSHIGLTEPAREWLEFAALLHDVGHHIDHKNHHKHAYYLITNGELLGFEREEIEIIALTARYHRKSAPKESDPEYANLPADARETVRALSALLRIADALDRSHYGAVRSVKAVLEDRHLTLGLATGGQDAALEIWEARQRIGLLEQLLGVDVQFRVTS